MQKHILAMYHLHVFQILYNTEHYYLFTYLCGKHIHLFENFNQSLTTIIPLRVCKLNCYPDVVRISLSGHTHMLNTNMYKLLCYCGTKGRLQKHSLAIVYHNQWFN